MELWPFKPHTERKDESEIAKWQAVVDTLTEAVELYILDLSDEERRLLQNNFWSVLPEIFKRAEQREPGISNLILNRAEWLIDQR